MKKLNLFRKIAVIAVVTAAVCAMLTVSAGAATNDYVKSGAEWVLDGVGWVALAAGVIYGVMSLVKGNVTRGVMCIIAGALARFLTSSAGIAAITSLGEAIGNLIFT